MSYLFVLYIYTQFKVWGKVFGDQILFTGSKGDLMGRKRDETMRGIREKIICI